MVLLQKVLIRTQAADSAELIEIPWSCLKTLSVFQVVTARSRVCSVYIFAYSSFNTSMNNLVQMKIPFVHFRHFLLKAIDAVPKY